MRQALIWRDYIADATVVETGAAYTLSAGTSLAATQNDRLTDVLRWTHNSPDGSNPLTLRYDLLGLKTVRAVGVCGVSLCGFPLLAPGTRYIQVEVALLDGALGVLASAYITLATYASQDFMNAQPQRLRNAFFLPTTAQLARYVQVKVAVVTTTGSWTNTDFGWVIQIGRVFAGEGLVFTDIAERDWELQFASDARLSRTITGAADAIEGTPVRRLTIPFSAMTEAQAYGSTTTTTQTLGLQDLQLDAGTTRPVMAILRDDAAQRGVVDYSLFGYVDEPLQIARQAPTADGYYAASLKLREAPL